MNTLTQFVESLRNFTLGIWIVSIGFWKYEKGFIKYNRSFSEFFRGKCHPLKVKYLARESFAISQQKLWKSKAGRLLEGTSKSWIPVDINTFFSRVGRSTLRINEAKIIIHDLARGCGIGIKQPNRSIMVNGLPFRFHTP